MMRTTLLAPFHFILEMQIVLAHSSTFWSYIFARDVAAISMHLQLLCFSRLLSATGFCKDGLQHCWKDKNRDRGTTAEVRDNRKNLHHLAVLATSRQDNSPSPDFVPSNPTMLVSSTSTMSGVVFCLLKYPEMMERDLGFRVSVAICIA
jgi:hypothetical protein